MEIWGTGTPLREFLYVDDLAQALVFLMQNYSAEGHVNVGSGIDLSIAELAQTVKEVVGFHGSLRFNTDMPDGTPRKIMDVSHINQLGWKAETSLRDGLVMAYQWACDAKVL